MLIILEGLERCFKTSSVNYIRSKLQNPRLICHHSSKPPKGLTKQQNQNWASIHYTELLESFSKLSAVGFDIIMDRAHIGEYVYGHMYRGNSATDDYMFEAERFGDISDMYLVLLTDDPANVLSREDGQSLSSNIESITKERERFIEGFNKSSILNKLHIDWNEFEPDCQSFEEKQKLYFRQLDFFLSI